MAYYPDQENETGQALRSNLSLSRKEVKNMKEILRYIKMKLQAEKGEVSVEWALVAVIMALIIAGVFNPGVSAALTAAIQRISDTIASAA
jgi:Flp pilus assembly pilin Flp